MEKRSAVRSAVWMGVLGVIGMGLAMVIAQPAFAGNCGGHCQAGKRCADLVKEKGTKRAEFRAEYNKCMTDPANYK